MTPIPEPYASRMEREADDYASTFSRSSKAFLAGAQALWNALLEPGTGAHGRLESAGGAAAGEGAPEFDEKATLLALDEWLRTSKNTSHMETARWQHSQAQPVIAALRAESEENFRKAYAAAGDVLLLKEENAQRLESERLALEENARLRAENERLKGRKFPIQTDRNYGKPFPRQIPWAMAELAYGIYSSRFGESQSLERIAQRGGFGPGEMDEFIPDWLERLAEHAEIERLERGGANE